MKITILTLFPQMFEGPFAHSIVKNAQEKGLVEIKFVDIRDFGIGKHKTVDDKPYGGGVGMVFRADVLKNAINFALDKNLSTKEQKIILTSASGKTFEQTDAVAFSKIKHLIIICGHYEGVDERIKKYIDYDLSIGNYVLTGGEIPAMVITDSVTRLVKGVLKSDATEKESFSVDQNTLEHPQYTRPEVFEGQKVPEVLTTGDHKKIENWKKENSKLKN